MPDQWMRLQFCPACAGEDRRHCFDVAGTKLYECAGCHLRFLDPCFSPETTAQAYESTASLMELHGFHEGYYDYGDLGRASATKKEFESALERLEGFLGADPGRRLFDVGYGNGFFLALARQRKWQVGGVDTSLHNQKLAKAKFGLDLAAGTFEKECRGADFYDAVSFWDVLEHLPDPSVLLRKAFEVIRPAGYVLIGVPHEGGFLSVLSNVLFRFTGGRLRQGVDRVYLPEHVAYYALGALDRLLERNGFVRRGFFYSSTDLAKYKLPFTDKLLAHMILMLGRIFRRPNRLIAFYQKKSGMLSG
ncbi:MAG: class I SAM-dependent methyltransferase [Candidatus Omnitrophota bacterium]|jgi:SAM-dependent methyltransferase